MHIDLFMSKKHYGINCQILILLHRLIKVHRTQSFAIDLTLTRDGEELDMGTDFDEFSRLSYHGNLEISEESYKNRLLLLGIMTDSGWDFYRNEWWHYQLFNS